MVVKIVYTLVQVLSKDNKIVLGLMSVLCFILGYAFKGQTFLPFRIFQSLTGFLYYFIGDISKPQFKNDNLKPFLIGVATPIFLIISILCSVWAAEPVLLVSNTLPSNIIATIIGGFSGIAFLVSISVLLSRLDLNGLTVKLLTYYGMNSIIIMGTHSIIHLSLRFILQKLGVELFVIVPIVFVMTFVLSIPIIMFINKRFPILIGK